MLPPDFLIRFEKMHPDLDPKRVFAPKKYVSYRINTLKISLDEMLKLLDDHKIIYERWPLFDAIIVEAQFKELINKSPWTSAGYLYAQGLESMLAVLALKILKVESVFDICSAPGSKTTMICQILGNNGFVLANESNRPRFYKLNAISELLGAKVTLAMQDGRFFKPKQGPFDRVLVDAPCSSESRFLIHEPKSFSYWSKHKIHESAHKQKAIVLNAFDCLKPGGMLVYSTCTFAPEENEGVIDYLLQQRPEAKLLPLSFAGIKTKPGLTQFDKYEYNFNVTQCCRILPDDKIDGFFIAQITK